MKMNKYTSKSLTLVYVTINELAKVYIYLLTLFGKMINK